MYRAVCDEPVAFSYELIDKDQRAKEPTKMRVKILQYLTIRCSLLTWINGLIVSRSQTRGIPCLFSQHLLPTAFLLLLQHYKMLIYLFSG